MWPFTKKRPPQNVEEQAVQSVHTRFNPSWAHTYEAKALPTPGTQNYAYENLGLYETTPIGPSVHNRMQFNVVQPTQMYAGFTMAMQGLGGLSTGQIFSYPLIAPMDTSGQLHG